MSFGRTTLNPCNRSFTPGGSFTCMRILSHDQQDYGHLHSRVSSLLGGLDPMVSGLNKGVDSTQNIG